MIMAYRHCEHLQDYDVENKAVGKYLVKRKGLSTVVCGPCGETAKANHEDSREIKDWLWGFPMVDAQDNELPPGANFRLGT